MLRADPARRGDDGRHQRRDQRRAQRDVVPAPRDRRHLDVAIALQQRHADGKGDGVRDQAAGERPLHERMIDASAIHTATAAAQLTQCARDAAPARHRSVPRKIVAALIGRLASAPSRDEGRIMVEREEDVGRPRRDRQRRDQRADHRPGALGDDGRRHHERGRDRHAQASVRRKVSSGDIDDVSYCPPWPGSTPAHHKTSSLRVDAPEQGRGCPVAQAPGTTRRYTAITSASSSPKPSGRS